MSMVAFDTLKLSRRLREAGMPTEQAEAVAEAEAEAFGDFVQSHLATKNDVGELRLEIAEWRAELKQDVATLRTEMYRALLVQTLAIAGLVIGILKFMK